MQQEFLLTETQFGFNVTENIVPQGVSYPKSIEAKSDVMRKWAKIIHLQTMFVFWSCSENKVLFDKYIQLIWVNFMSKFSSLICKSQQKCSTPLV